MINRICCVCGEYVTEVWTLVVSDDKEKVEFSGHKDHIDSLQIKVNSIKDVHKKKLQQVLKELNL